MKSKFLLFLLLIISPFVLFGCLGQNQATNNSSEVNGQPVQPEPTANANAPVDDDQVNLEPEAKIITGEVKFTTDQVVKNWAVKSANFSFDPTEIKVKKGDKIKIFLINQEGTHDFVLDEFNVKTDKITGQGTVTAEFTADRVGTFEYYCSVGQHRVMGMKGNLIVE